VELLVLPTLVLPVVLPLSDASVLRDVHTVFAAWRNCDRILGFESSVSDMARPPDKMNFRNKKAAVQANRRQLGKFG
jgi:hypothetical protein